MSKKYSPYRLETEVITSDGIIDAKNCNEIIFINKGTAQAEVDGFPLANNEFITDAGNEQEINQTKYRVVFNVPLAGTKFLWVRRKLYID